MVYDLLTDLDKQKIDNYRREFAYSYGSSPVSIEEILGYWNAAKELYLEKLFGDQLIITRPVIFKEDIYDIEKHISEIFFEDKRIKEFKKAICNIYLDRTKDIEGPWWHPVRVQHRFVCNLFDHYVLAKNKIEEYGFEFDENSNVFELPIQDTSFKIQKGMKPIRVITKIANAYGIGITPDENGVSDLEYFRRRHSLGLNQKLLKGELCLSIHPLDYMTMSDNAEGWDSCMSWMNDGEYKQGTVEMMNSPCVVVAYLSAGADKYHWGMGEESCWNSKKWRSLFVVDKNFIINVKSYPYENANLVKETLKELAKLSGWEGTEPQRYLYLERLQEHRYPHIPVEINGRKVALDFCSGAMYNDFGRTEHYIVLNPNSNEDLIDYSYYYSGESECMWCGCIEAPYIGPDQGEGSLVCGNCNPTFWCECCEERFDGDENDYYRTDDDEIVCGYCWENSVSEELMTRNDYLNDSMERLYLSIEADCCNINGAEYRYMRGENVGSYQWYELFTIDKPRTGEGKWNEPINYVLVSDCTEKGLEQFCLYDEDDVKYYLQS